MKTEEGFSSLAQAGRWDREGRVIRKVRWACSTTVLNKQPACFTKDWQMLSAGLIQQILVISCWTISEIPSIALCDYLSLRLGCPASTYWDHPSSPVLTWLCGGEHWTRFKSLVFPAVSRPCVDEWIGIEMRRAEAKSTSAGLVSEGAVSAQA